MKRVLLLMTDMECGGVQTSLINFINELKKYDVDITVALDYAEGVWFNRLPSGIHIQQIHYSCEGIHKLIWPHRKVSLFQDIIYHVLVHIVDKFVKNTGRNNRYTFLLKYIRPIEGEYDIAIDYHGYGAITTSILANKVTAKYKAVFIHDENMDCLRAAEVDLKEIDEFFSVSKSCKAIFDSKFPEYKENSSFFPNIIDREQILQKANFSCDIVKKPNELTLVTVGRVMKQKGYDFAVKVAHELKKRKVPFRWYCLGEGFLMDEIKSMIREYNLDEEFIMLGRKDNPYPYMKLADIYVQTSYHEGFGLAIAEALILEKMVVSTRLDCVLEQIEHGVNGWVENMDVEAFAQCIVEADEYRKKDIESMVSKIRERNSKNLDCVSLLFKNKLDLSLMK